MYICMDVWYWCVWRVNRAFLSRIRLLFGSSILKFHRRKGRDWFLSVHLSYICSVDCHELLARDWGWKRVDGKTWKEDVVIQQSSTLLALLHFWQLRTQKSVLMLQGHYCQACHSSIVFLPSNEKAVSAGQPVQVTGDGRNGWLGRLISRTWLRL